MKRDDTVYLKHMLDSVEKIERYASGMTLEAFSDNSLIQDAVIRQLQIIGEAAKRLSLELCRQYENVPWSDISGMRNKLVHDYFGVDVEKVWLTIVEDLPPLKLNIQQILVDYRS